MNFSFHHVLFTMVAFAAFLAPGAYSTGQEKAESDQVEAPGSLDIGDPAPKLQVDHWFRGNPIESFSKDHVYVVEFWATWCGPCIKSMPHLSELAERYADDGLIVIALTTADASNTREAVENFVKGPGEKYRFQYAMCESETNFRNYMEAAGQRGIPCSFIVDREGKIAYFGHPQEIDYVIERVVKGQWRGKADADELREMNESIGKLVHLAQADPEKALEITDRVRRINPGRAKGMDFAYGEVVALCKTKQFDRARATIESLSDSSNKSIDWGAVAMLSGLLASKELNPQGTHQDFALSTLKGAEDALKEDWQNLMQVGIAYQMSGNKEKFKECMDKVISLCPDEQIKKTLKTMVELQAPTPEK